MKWRKKDIKELEISHLRNIIPWIKRNNLACVEEQQSKYTEYCISMLKKVINSRIDCIQAELDFRILGIDNRAELEFKNRFAEQFIDEFEKNEKQYRKGSWVTQQEFIEQSNNRSDAKFEETYGFYPDHM